MKKKSIIIGIVLIIILLFCSISSYGISFNLEISGESTVEKGDTIQLKAEYWVGNEMIIDDDPNSIGEVSREDVTSKAEWASSDETIATVDNKGLVTGISEGSVSITAKYYFEEGEYRNSTHEITVTERFNPENAGIRFFIDDPGPAMILNSQETFGVMLNNIPTTENENIEFKIENENIAKIIDVEYTQATSDTGFVLGYSARAKVKYLAIGTTKLTASIKYKGKTYSDSYDLDVIEYNEWLDIGAEDPASTLPLPPMKLNVSEEYQFKARLRYARGSLPITDVSEDAIWTSSNTKAGTIDTKGKFTAIGEGKTTITVKYTLENGRELTNTVEVIVEGKTDPAPTPTPSEDPTIAPSKIPQTGEKIAFIIIMISILGIIISGIIIKRIKLRKEIQ